MNVSRRRDEGMAGESIEGQWGGIVGPSASNEGSAGRNAVPVWEVKLTSLLSLASSSSAVPASCGSLNLPAYRLSD